MDHAHREVTACLNVHLQHLCKKIIKKKQTRKTYFVAQYCGTQGQHRYVMW